MSQEKKSTLGWFMFLFENYGLLLGFIFLCLFLSIASPYFLTVENILNVGRQISITAIVAFGMTFVITAAQIDLSVGSVIALTGVTAAAFLRQENYPLGLWVIAIFAIGLIIGLLHGFFVAKTGKTFTTINSGSILTPAIFCGALTQFFEKMARTHCTRTPLLRSARVFTAEHCSQRNSGLASLRLS